MVKYEYNRDAVLFGVGGALQEYHRNELGNRSKSLGPVYIIYSKNGLKTYEEWRIDGFLHRLDGPAIRKIEPSGNTYLEFWLHGKQYFFEDWLEMVKDMVSAVEYERLGKSYDDFL